MKSFSFVLLALCVGTAFAQQQSSTGVPVDAGVPAGVVNNPIVSLFGVALEHNYVGVFGFANGIYDHYGLPGGAANSFGALVGGGANINHMFRNGSLGLVYRGDYRGYVGTSPIPSGTDQNLSLFFTKRLTRRWSITNSESAGRFTYGGGGYYGLQSSTVNSAIMNPFSSSTSFLSASLGATYQQSARLSYDVGANFFLTRYDYKGSFGSTGGSGWIGVNYRVTARTTFGGTISYSDFIYQNNAGKTRMQSAFATVAHQFSPRWQASASGGATKSFSAGTIVLPFNATVEGQVVSGYLVGPYNNVSVSPYFQGSLSRLLRTSSISVTGGENVIPGNGFFLAQRNIFFNANYSRRVGRSVLSTAFIQNRMSTVSNQTGNYSSTALTASYGYSLGAHMGLNFYYMYLHYGSIGAFDSRNESQLGFGLTFSSKNVPVTPF